MRVIASLGQGRRAWVWLLLLAAAVACAPAAAEDRPGAGDKAAAEDKDKDKDKDKGGADFKPATLVVQVPADARLLIDGEQTKQTGETRRFYTPPLDPAKSYHYDLEVIVKGKDGKDVRWPKKRVHVRAGRETPVDLRQPPEGVGDLDKDKDRDKDLDKDKGRFKDKDTDKGGTKDKDKLAGTNGDEKPEREPDIFFVPTPQEVVDKMLEMAAPKKGDVVYDLGCGDGRIVVTAAKKYGCTGVGIDIDPKRIKESRASVEKAGVEDLVTIKKGDIFKEDLSKANIVTLYLLPELNVKLIPQLQKLKPGSRVVSHDFDMDGVKPKETATVKSKDGREHKVYLWVAPIEKEKE